MTIRQSRTRTFLQCTTSRLFFCLLYLHSLAIALSVNGEQAEEDASNGRVFQWLQEEHGDNFYWNPKLRLDDNDDSIQTQESLEKSEILMIIPSSAIISTINSDNIDNKQEENDEEELYAEDMFCALAERLWDELLEGDESDYAPYMQHILHESNSIIIPNFWSTIGKKLIGMVYGEYLTTEYLIDWIDDFESCRDFLALPNDHDDDDDEFDAAEILIYGDNDYTAIWNSDIENLRRHVLATAAQHQVDQKLFVPLYDHLDHHLVDHNVKHIVKDDSSVVIMAQRQISVGETLYRPSQVCLFECVEPTQPIVLDIVRNFGHLPKYPHYWELPSLKLAFMIHAGGGEETMDGVVSESTPTLSWIVKPHEAWQIESLESEYKRLQEKYTGEVLKSNETVPAHEWKVIEAYSSALQTALGLAVKVGREEILTPPPSAATDENEEYTDKGQRRQQEKGQKEAEEGECIAVEDKKDESSADEDKKDESLDEDDENDESTEWEPWSITHKTSCTNCNLDDLAQSRGCDEYTYSTIHNQTTWTHLRAAYVAILRENATIETTYESGIMVPFKIGHSPGRGRGVFVIEDVAKGTLVWTGENTGAFTTGDQFRQYLSVLPNVLVCDLTNWCYTSNGASNTSSLIECDLDEGSLINAFENKQEHTLGCNEDMVEDTTLCLENLYALRDIRGGEELLTNYDDFSTASWKDFGL
ncbi:unnamed protein product [Cylindrotheca closterium]|uniref:SET domain-containing protein n=1 Tax=Cylindrotheca closterium TaxID=2856 RepID=A0AAD2CVB8_9STRA|nr:unnamed protein product [Cylindrotheca closterium]